MCQLSPSENTRNKLGKHKRAQPSAPPSQSPIFAPEHHQRFDLEYSSAAAKRMYTPFLADVETDSQPFGAEACPGF